MLTILFVMIAEVLIYVPSIANFRVNWLKDRLAALRDRIAAHEGGRAAEPPATPTTDTGVASLATAPLAG